MKSLISKQNTPFVLLIVMVFSWSYYYLSSSWFNGYGSDKHEWFILIDVFVTIPLVCYFCLRKTPKEALIKSLAYMGLLILLGSYIIPNEEKHIWLQLEKLRYLVVFVVVSFELFIISTVIFAIRSAFKQNLDPDLAISEAIEKIAGNSFVSAIIQFDIRLWTFVLFPKKIKSENYQGNQHFYCHLKDGTQSFLQGFMILIIFEIPLLHLLLHFIWSPLAANIITGLTVFGLAFFIAEYRAIEKRPISMSDKQLIIRYGLNNPLSINLDEIDQVKHNNIPVYRHSDIKRFNSIGIPNIEISLKDKHEHSYKKVYLGVNEPYNFIKAIERGLK